MEAADEIAIIVAVALLTGFLVGQGGGIVVALIGFVVIDVLAIVLIVRRVKMWYVRYVLTDFRVLRTWGVFNRHLAWIPWPKVTDVSYAQTVAGRLFGYATVRIESANENSGFKEIKDLHDPLTFHDYIVQIVEEQSGTKIPDWMLERARPRGQRRGSP